MEFWPPLILGLVGGLHCAGMCGPLALALPAAGNGAVRVVLGRVAYNLGRIATYALLGVIFGLFGKSLVLAGIQRWASIGLGAALLIGLFASRKLALWRPVTALVNLLKSSLSGLLRRQSLPASAAFGLLNGLLPCGLVYVACAGATAAGGIMKGAAFMAVFGAGTMPTMLAIGLSGKLIPPPIRLKMTRLIPVSVFLLAALLILRGMALGIPYVSPDLAAGSCCGR